MTADVQRELAERWLRATLIGSLPGAHPWHEIVDAHLLPTVQALIAAAEKRAAAKALRDAAATAPVVRFENGYPVRAVPVSDLLSFAAALDLTGADSLRRDDGG